jgi:hypothetical protein
VVSLGKKHFFNPEYAAVSPSPSDLAIIMYTSKTNAMQSVCTPSLSPSVPSQAVPPVSPKA